MLMMCLQCTVVMPSGVDHCQHYQNSSAINPRVVDHWLGSQCVVAGLGAAPAGRVVSSGQRLAGCIDADAHVVSNAALRPAVAA